VGACAVAELEWSDNEFALGKIADLCPDMLDHPNEFVADWPERVRRLAPVVPEVGAADATESDPHDSVGGRRDYGIGPVSDLDTTRPKKHRSAHTLLFSNLGVAALRRLLFEKGENDRGEEGRNAQVVVG
jgi:hypothetical protein